MARSAVASTIAAQKSKILLASPRQWVGNLAGSGSSPTHKREPFWRSALRNWSRKVMAGLYGAPIFSFFANESLRFATFATFNAIQLCF